MGMAPIVVYSHIDEPQNIPANGFEVVQSVFAIRSEDGLVYTGKGSPEYVGRWRERFNWALDNNSSWQQGWGKKQLEKIEKLLSDELSDVLYDLKENIRTNSLLDDKDHQIEQILNIFDAEVKKLRKDFAKQAELFAKVVEMAAHEMAQSRYTEQEGGNAAKAICRTVKDWWINTEGKEGRLNKILSDVWEEAFKEHAQDYLERIRNLTFERLKIALPEPPENQSGYMQKWKYPSADIENLPITPEVLEQIRILFCHPEEITSVKQDEAFKTMLKLLPVLALELSRLKTIVEFQNNKIKGFESTQSFEEEFRDTTETGKTILTAIGAMLAIDFSADGKLDIIEKLGNLISGGANAAAGATAVANPYVLIAVAVIIVVTVAIAAVNKVNAEHKLCRASLRNAIEADEVALHSHILNGYDDLMDKLRDTIEGRLDICFQRNHSLGAQNSARKLIERIDRKCKLLLGEIKLDSLLA